MGFRPHLHVLPVVILGRPIARSRLAWLVPVYRSDARLFSRPFLGLPDNWSSKEAVAGQSKEGVEAGSEVS
jgi:hypothetical protein